ncbi:hypothetical protein [Collimonas sp.]|jgi:hypothetical protein|uniref:hypothetical protein n=1 Tax=Collimonas sp. TaxID=1963772 RepID=UPI002B5F1750|nr:hypothetical protein [Collimonas sp.]HWW05883.1 hypothetical protein [Collimonas sp.]
MQAISALVNTADEVLAPQATALSQILLDSIPNDKRHQEAYRVLGYLAKETIRVGSNNSFAKVTTKAIHTDLGGNLNSEPSKWINQIWKTLKGRVYPELQPTLIRRCRDQGLTHYPTVHKTSGNPAYYYLDFEPLPDQPSEAPTFSDINDVQSLALAYEPDLTLRLSRRGKFLFKQGLILDGRKRWAMAAWLMFQIVGTAAVTILLWVLLASDKSPISMSHLIAGLLMVFVPWLLYHRTENLMHLLDDRVGLAPDWMLHWKEFGATVEVVKGKSSDEPRRIQVLRYTATCPVCGAMVKLDRGEPDFPRRLVGRCGESPREHVFSFDRITKSGTPLVAPPVMRWTHNAMEQDSNMRFDLTR